VKDLARNSEARSFVSTLRMAVLDVFRAAVLGEESGLSVEARSFTEYGSG
jgi:hypothetical protein